MFDIRCNPAWILDSLREADAAFSTTRELWAEVGWQARSAAEPPVDLGLGSEAVLDLDLAASTC
jgi:hypothetical protein